MLNLESAVQSSGLTLFQDYSDPNLYYYLPDNPELARQGGDPFIGSGASPLALYHARLSVKGGRTTTSSTRWGSLRSRAGIWRRGRLRATTCCAWLGTPRC